MSDETASFATFEVHIRERELYKQGRRIRLQGKPFDLLCLLVARPGELIPRRELERALWPDTEYGDFDRSLNSAVNRLRFALGDSAQNPRFIETVPAHGYRFICSVRSGHPGTPTERSARARWFARAGAGLAAGTLIALAIAFIRSPPTNPPEPRRASAAEVAYAKGRTLWLRKEREALLKSRDYFLTAIASDADYALAWTGLADTYNFMGGIGLIDRREAFARATEAAQEALRIEPGLAAAHASLAEARFRLGPDDDQVEPSFRRALQLDPDYALGRYWYGMFLASKQRHDEALLHLRAARDREPLNPRFQADLGIVVYLAGDPDLARRLIEEATSLHPSSQKAHLSAGWLARNEGETERAAAAFSRVVELSEDYPLYALELAALTDADANAESLERFRALALRSIRCPEGARISASHLAEL